MIIRKYTADRKEDWNKFVESSKNGTFLFNRDYMEYHSDRFEDCSYMFLDDNGRICALFPASRHGEEVRSHGGLTYGGLVMDEKSSGGGENSPLNMLPMLAEELKKEGVKRLQYKPVPHIYHRQPAEEDLYALFRMNATLQIRNLASTIQLKNRIPSSRLGKRACKRQRLAGISVSPTTKAADFWDIIVDDRRERHGVKPVHTAEEMQYLRDLFPDKILFYTAEANGEILAGAVIYRDRGVLHLQYAAANDAGKANYAVDVIYHEIIYNLFPDDDYFDFGINNEDAGQYLNEGMVRHKEEFGARSIAYDAYLLEL